MTEQKRKLIATFTGREAKALHNDEAEIFGTYRRGVYELYMTVEKEARNRFSMLAKISF